MIATPALASSALSIGFGLSYGEGNGGLYAPMYGAPIYGYGGAANFGAIGGACQSLLPPCATGCSSPCGGGGGFPGVYGPGAMPPPVAQMPAPLPQIPPQLSVQGMMAPITGPVGWGPGYASYPNPGLVPGTCGLPCQSGLVPMPVGPVPGGPMIMPRGGGNSRSVSSSSADIIVVGGTNEWEKNDTADIVWATAMGLGMQATNVYPVTCFRNSPTVIAPNFYSSGNRSLGFVERTHGTP
jgi:hypothetical protein